MIACISGSIADTFCGSVPKSIAQETIIRLDQGQTVGGEASTTHCPPH